MNLIKSNIRSTMLSGKNDIQIYTNNSRFRFILDYYTIRTIMSILMSVYLMKNNPKMRPGNYLDLYTFTLCDTI